MSAVLAVAASMHAQADPLPSWNDGGPRQRSSPLWRRYHGGRPNFVPPVERIATFDNDGTLWAEQPLYFQSIFLDRVK